MSGGSFTDTLDVNIGDATKASDYDSLADNTEFNREKAGAEHDMDIATGDGSHNAVKHITPAADSTYDIGETSTPKRVRNIYTDTLGDSGQQLALNSSSVRAANVPAVHVMPNAGGLANVTGDGTVYTIVFGTEVFDQGGDFSGTTFTAPVTGRYLICGQVTVSNVASGHTTAAVNIVTSNRSYLMQYNPYAINSGTLAPMPFSMIADLDTSDTATVTIAVTGGAKTVYVNNNTTGDVRTWLSIQMIA